MEGISNDSGAVRCLPDSFRDQNEDSQGRWRCDGDADGDEVGGSVKIKRARKVGGRRWSMDERNVDTAEGGKGVLAADPWTYRSPRSVSFSAPTHPGANVDSLFFFPFLLIRSAPLVGAGRDDDRPGVSKT